MTDHQGELSAGQIRLREMICALSQEGADAYTARERFCIDPLVGGDPVTGASLYDHLPCTYLVVHQAAADVHSVPLPTEVKGLTRFYYDYPEADSFDSRVCGLGRKPDTVWNALCTLCKGGAVPVDDPPVWFPDLGLLRYGAGSMHRVLAVGLWGGGCLVSQYRDNARLSVVVGSVDEQLLTALAEVKAWLEPQGWRLSELPSTLERHSGAQIKEIAAVLRERHVTLESPPASQELIELVTVSELWTCLVDAV